MKVSLGRSRKEISATPGPRPRRLPVKVSERRSWAGLKRCSFSATSAQAVKVSQAILWISLLSTPFSWVIMRARSSPQRVVQESSSSSLEAAFARHSRAFSSTSSCMSAWPTKPPTLALITESVIFSTMTSPLGCVRRPGATNREYPGLRRQVNRNRQPRARIAKVNAGRYDTSPVDYDLLVFDLDGTLVDSAADISASLNRTLARLGRERIPHERVLAAIGSGVRKLIERTTTPPIEPVMEAFLEHYAEHLLDETALFPGVAETLGRLRGRKIVLSNKPEVMSRKIVEGLGIAKFFEAVYGGDSFPVRKPDPECW